MPIFVENDPSIEEILQIFDFSKWPLPPILIFEFVNFIGGQGPENLHASPCQT